MTKIYQGNDTFRIWLDSGKVMFLTGAEMRELNEGLEETNDELTETIEKLCETLTESVDKHNLLALSVLTTLDDINGFLDGAMTSEDYAEIEDTIKELMELAQDSREGIS
jgi:hypothetical protein